MDLLQYLIVPAPDASSDPESSSSAAPKCDPANIDMDLLKSLLLPNASASTASAPAKAPPCECEVPPEDLSAWPSTGALMLNSCDRTCRFCLKEYGGKVSRKTRPRAALVHRSDESPAAPKFPPAKKRKIKFALSCAISALQDLEGPPPVLTIARIKVIFEQVPDADTKIFKEENKEPED